VVELIEPSHQMLPRLDAAAVEQRHHVGLVIDTNARVSGVAPADVLCRHGFHGSRDAKTTWLTRARGQSTSRV